jgi:membrane-bound lytic murein transglycosylase D
MPRETRNYIPAYIAATYLMEYYKEHEITPDYPDLELQITESTVVYDAISFYRISQLTGISLETIKMLNPAYKRDLIPGDERGHYLILPKRVMPAVKDYIAAQRPDHLADEFFDDDPVDALPVSAAENYGRTLYYAKGGETLPQVAQKLKCSVHQLYAWNPNQADTLVAGQTLVVYFPKELRRFKPFKPIPPLAELPSRPLTASQPIDSEQLSKVPKLSQLYVFYTVRKRQSLREFALNRPDLFLPSLLELNGLDPDDKLSPDDAVRAIWKAQ